MTNIQSIRLWFLLFVLAFGGAVTNAYIAASRIMVVSMAVPAIYLVLVLAVVVFVNKNRGLIRVGGD